LDLASGCLEAASGFFSVCFGFSIVFFGTVIWPLTFWRSYIFFFKVALVVVVVVGGGGWMGPHFSFALKRATVGL